MKKSATCHDNKTYFDLLSLFIVIEWTHSAVAWSCCSNSDISNYLIVDLEWAVAVVRAAHVVEPPEHDGIHDGAISKSDKICQPFLCTTLAAMASTK